MSVREGFQDKFKELPVPKWKRAPFSEGLFEKVIGEVTVSAKSNSPQVSITSLEDVSEKYYTQLRDLKGANGKSIGEKFDHYISGFGKVGLLVLSNHKQADMPVVKIDYKMEDSNANYPIEQLIVAEEGAKLSVIIDLHAPKAEALQYFGKTKIVTKAGAHVKVVKIQRFESDAHIFDLNVSHVEEGAKLEVIDLQIGGNYKAVSHESNLEGRRAYSEMKSAYYGEGKERLDLSYTMSHQAKQTESVILAKGALAEQAQKVFRGNLFFKTGASESVGKEQEFVTMLSKEAQTDSFPALMCSEDDVIGEHAASIGQVDEEKLFYLMSRGLSEIEAKRLLVKASFDEVIGQIEDDALETILYEEIERRIH